MNIDDKRLIRQIIRQVHPDLFSSNPYERQCNSDSLQALNSYVDCLARGDIPKPTRLEFFVREQGVLLKRQAELPALGSVAPLFFAFGLISEAELQASDPYAAAADTNFVSWLSETVQQAVRTAEQHEVLKTRIKLYRETLLQRFKLASVQVGAEFAVSLAEQERQVEALSTLEQGLTALSQDSSSFEGLSIQLYHPDMCPVESYAYMDEEGKYALRTSYMKSYIADDGSVHLVADAATIREQIQSLDLERARMLAFVAGFWQGRVRELTPLVQSLLGVKAVWCDTKTEQNSQKFVIWAGYLLEKRDEVRRLLGGRRFQFSLIVHSEADGPLINFHTSSPILNVRTDCPPSHLMEFLLSETGTAASEAASEVQTTREREEALLEKVRVAFGLKCIIKICMNDKVLEGAARLLENAEAIKRAVNLQGASLALDDCYEVWDSGFISVPYNFKLSELPSKLRMLQSGQKSVDPPAAPPSSNLSTAAADSRNANGTSPPGVSNGSISSSYGGQSGMKNSSSGVENNITSSPFSSNGSARASNGMSSSQASSNLADHIYSTDPAASTSSKRFAKRSSAGRSSQPVAMRAVQAKPSFGAELEGCRSQLGLLGGHRLSGGCLLPTARSPGQQLMHRPLRCYASLHVRVTAAVGVPGSQCGRGGVFRFGRL